MHSGQRPGHWLSNGCQSTPVNTLGPHLLLVEDTPDLALWLGTALRQAGMRVSFARDGHEALAQLAPGHGLDAVLLDLQLPGPDGLSVLQTLRERGDPVPVLVLTARASVPDRVLGLNLGADDYLPKPFDLSELEARLQALLRRPGRTRNTRLRLGPLEMDRDSGQVSVHDQPLALTPREAAALRALLEKARRTVSKDELHQAVFGDETVEREAVEVLIHRLRKKLEACARPAGQAAAPGVHTIRGLGYMLMPASVEER
jgi:DNA-binding response OmpR family regulator